MLCDAEEGRRSEVIQVATWRGCRVKYKVVMHYPDGEDEEFGEVYDSEKEANDAGLDTCACYREGGEILYLSNPGDYPFGETDDCDYEVIEVDE